MVLYFLNNFFSDIPGLAIFNYLTVRSVCAILTSLSICLIVGPRFIKFMENKQKKGQPIRIDGPITSLRKKGTPTMGGILILLSLIEALIWSDSRK